MPIFLRNRLLLIHIPKCGGDTLSHFLSEHNDPPFLFAGDGSVLVNGHSPQHMTWMELQKAGWPVSSDFRIVALVRHPIRRVLSEFHYVQTVRPDLAHLIENPTRFLDEFLPDTADARRQFDNHNVSIIDFLKNASGAIDTSIEICHTEDMDRVASSLGLPSIPIESRRNVTSQVRSNDSEPVFCSSDILRIAERYRDDIAWFERNFPLTGPGERYGF